MHLTLSLNVHADGLSFLRFCYLDEKTRFEQNALDRIASLARNVKHFELSYMGNSDFPLNEEGRKALVSLATREFEDCTTLEVLNLEYFTDVAEEGEQLIQALSTSQITKLTLLNLAVNPTWFSNEENALLVADFATRQTALKTLYLSYNGFSKADKAEVAAEMREMLSQMPNYQGMNIDMNDY